MKFVLRLFVNLFSKVVKSIFFREIFFNSGNHVPPYSLHPGGGVYPYGHVEVSLAVHVVWSGVDVQPFGQEFTRIPGYRHRHLQRRQGWATVGVSLKCFRGEISIILYDFFGKFFPRKFILKNIHWRSRMGWPRGDRLECSSNFQKKYLIF